MITLITKNNDTELAVELNKPNIRIIKILSDNQAWVDIDNTEPYTEVVTIVGEEKTVVVNNEITLNDIIK